MPIYFFFAALFTAGSSAQALKIGEPAPPLSLEHTIPSGMHARWSDLRGKPVVLEFWATWCGNCVAEIPRLNEMVAKFPGVQFISITDEDAPVVERFLATHPVQGWVGLDQKSATFKAFTIEARPQTIFVDGAGIVRGLMHPAQVDAAVLGDFVAGRPVKSYSLPARLRMLQDSAEDPVFTVMLRPSDHTRPGGVFSVDHGKFEGDHIQLKTILAFAYGMTDRHVEGPEQPLKTRYDFAVLLPAGIDGDIRLLREMMETSFRLKTHHETREMDAAVLKLAGAKLEEPAGGAPVSTLLTGLEWRLNRMVVNETGLDNWKPVDLPEKPEEIASVLAAHGIALAYERRPVDFLIVDSLELPSFRINLPGR